MQSSVPVSAGFASFFDILELFQDRLLVVVTTKPVLLESSW